MFSNRSAPYDYYAQTRTTRAVEDARLAMQAVIGLAAERPILDRLGLEGKSIHCVGAGPCFYEHQLFEVLRPGKALASDIDRENITALREGNSSSAISYAVLDATQRHPWGYDISSERFLLIQLSDSAARGVVGHMNESLSPGGRAILVEYVNSHCVTTPQCDALVEVRKVMMKRFSENGADPDIGLRLEQFLTDAGMTEVVGHDVPYSINGAQFNQEIVVAGRSFGTPAEIIGNSYERRFGAECPDLVRGLREWLHNARQPGSSHRLEHRYRMAIGVKPQRLAP